MGKTRASNLDTPTKNKVRGAVQIARAKSLRYTKSDLAERFNVSLNEVDYALHDKDERSTPDQPSRARPASKVIKRDTTIGPSKRNATSTNDSTTSAGETKRRGKAKSS